MADVVVSKTNLFSSCHHHHQHISVFPKTWNQSSLSFSSKTDFHGKRIGLQQLRRPLPSARDPPQFQAINSQLQAPGFRIGKAHRWWEKGIQPNMKEVTSAQDLVDSLSNAGDKLVVLDFFSPGCGGCKALHPKICQFADMNPDVQFLQVNYEEHKSMCYSLNVHVLPFFRFYRGAHGRVCSFSCTNATIKKFKDALAKHKPERCSLGPTKGLEEKELLALSANKDLKFTYTPKQVEFVPAKASEEMIVAAPSRSNSESLPLPSTTLKSGQISEERNMVSAGR
ncbi:putative monodehydroascorbate reductase (NADH) [Rosa chinensis]|uniref:Putative monodehydroascorbate reductase (NADH) n=1 Tax=Rosa chinensis TaxID=74649 RepID=A0A2P6RHN8_ROSCH|nr:thioredoxin-like 1-1, chloroplastic [Rosa chinensis]PRQ45942.1 putative monodehydroascorbate reductase (NADH) [Rosa chinensis]